MISYQRLFHEIERYTMQAKAVQNEQQYRELLSAIRALCDVALNAQSQNQPVQLHSVKTKGEMSTPSSISTLSTKKLEEDDANGESIFDF